MKLEQRRRKTHELRSIFQSHDSTESRSDIDLVELLVGLGETRTTETREREKGEKGIGDGSCSYGLDVSAFLPFFSLLFVILDRSERRRELSVLYERKNGSSR